MSVTRLIDSFRNSQLFIALCGGVLAIESYFEAGVRPHFLVPFTVFFSTLFVYNGSRFRVTLGRTITGSVSLNLDGGRLNMVLAGLSAPIILLLITGLPWQKGMVFLATGFLSTAYMMPFTIHGIHIKGLRQRLYLKNILLSAVWALSTVCLPLVPSGLAAVGLPGLFILLSRQFFFIYALSVIYDIRDVHADIGSGMPTLAIRLGERRVRLISICSLGIFTLLLFADPVAGTPACAYLRTALLLSVACSAAIILKTHSGSTPGYYAFVVDGAMVLKPLLVIAACLV